MAKLRFAYLSGPVDAFDVHQKWSATKALGYFGTSHLSDFLSACVRLDAEGYIITTLPTDYSRGQVNQFLIENRPLADDLRGLTYHVRHAVRIIQILVQLIRYRPNVLVVTAEQNFWFLLWPLRLTGVAIVPALTCTVWHKFRRPKLANRLLLFLNKHLFYRRCPDGIMVMSQDIEDQVRAMIGNRDVSILTCLPIYSRSQFASFGQPVLDDDRFNIFFAGRIEVNKGVFDIVEIAGRLEREYPGKFHVEMCGEGAAEAALSAAIRAKALESVITCHGFCEREKLSALLDGCQAVIVPTTTAFEEGFNMVCAEAALAGRPLITSAVCPALRYVRAAAIEVPPDDVGAYYEAIVALASDGELYEEKRRACATVQEQFYDPANGWGAKFVELAFRLTARPATGGRLANRRLANDLSALDHQLHVADRGKVLRRVAVDRDQVGEEAGADGSAIGQLEDARIS